MKYFAFLQNPGRPAGGRCGPVVALYRAGDIHGPSCFLDPDVRGPEGDSGMPRSGRDCALCAALTELFELICHRGDVRLGAGTVVSRANAAAAKQSPSACA